VFWGFGHALYAISRGWVIADTRIYDYLEGGQKEVITLATADRNLYVPMGCFTLAGLSHHRLKMTYIELESGISQLTLDYHRDRKWR